jgi:hypothetical protein
VDWIGLAQERDRWWALVNAVMNLWVPYNSGNFLTSCKPVSFSRRTLLYGVNVCMNIYIFTFTYNIYIYIYTHVYLKAWCAYMFKTFLKLSGKAFVSLLAEGEYLFVL